MACNCNSFFLFCFELIFHFQGNGPTTGSEVFYGPKTTCKTSKKTSTKKLTPEVASAVKLGKDVICQLSFTEEEDKAILNTTRSLIKIPEQGNIYISRIANYFEKFKYNFG